MSTPEAIDDLNARLIAAICKPYEIEPAVLARVNVSIGATLGDSDAALPTMMGFADEALYAAKAAGKGRCILHNGGLATGKAEPSHALCVPAAKAA